MALNALARKVAGDWFEVREASKSPDDLVGVLQLSWPDISEITEALRDSTEEGTLEYKTHALTPILSRLEEARFRSLEHEDLSHIESAFSRIIMVALIERLISIGTIEAKDIRADEAPVEDQTTDDIKEIISEIQSRAKEESGFKERPEVKNILMQVSKYKNEMETLRKLTHNAPRDKAAQIVKNSQTTFGEIYASIRRNYQAIVREDVAAEPREVRNPLLKYDLKPLAKVYMDQAQLFLEFRSSVAFVRTEQFRPRETLVDLSDRGDELRKAINHERERLEAVAGKQAAPLTRQFATASARALERLIPG